MHADKNTFHRWGAGGDGGKGLGGGGAGGLVGFWGLGDLLDMHADKNTFHRWGGGWGGGQGAGRLLPFPSCSHAHACCHTPDPAPCLHPPFPPKRFDKFNLKYNPCGQSRLREIFIKQVGARGGGEGDGAGRRAQVARWGPASSHGALPTPQPLQSPTTRSPGRLPRPQDNLIHGRFLAELTKEFFTDLEASKWAAARRGWAGGGGLAPRAATQGRRAPALCVPPHTHTPDPLATP
jgi:hypothetical protein